MSTTLCSATVKQCLGKTLEQAQQCLATLVNALPGSLDELARAEELLREGMLRIGRDLLQGWSEAANPRAAMPDCSECQEMMRHKGYVESNLVTTLGNVRLRRPRFRCEHCGAECYPHDDRLRFLEHAISWPLAKVIGRLGAQMPFDQARQNLLADYGVSLSKQTLQAVCEDAGAAIVESEDDERKKLQSLPVKERAGALPDSEFAPEKAYVFGDGTMIHATGDWHEIRVASVLATDVEDKPLRVDHRARFLSCEDFGWQLLLLARRAGYHRAKLRAFIADGAPLALGTRSPAVSRRRSDLGLVSPQRTHPRNRWSTVWPRFRGGQAV